MRRMIVLLTTVLLLASASIAAAECAWVLWLHATEVEILPKQNKVTRNTWETLSAFDTKKACESEQKKSWEDSYRLGKEKEKHFGAIMFGYDEFTHIFMSSQDGKFSEMDRWNCLPDTIDPRAQKQ